MSEERPVDGFPGYFVTSDGVVLSRKGDAPIVMAGWTDPDGYRHVTLSRGARGTAKRRPVHQLVALAFHGPKPFPEAEVRHLDGVRSNNSASNLVWGTATENAADRIRHGRGQVGMKNPNVRLSPSDVLRVRDLRSKGWSQEKIAYAVGCGQSQVSRILRGATRREVA